MPVWGGVIPGGRLPTSSAYIHAGFPAVPGARHSGAHRPGIGRRRKGALQKGRVRQLPRHERSRRGTQPAASDKTIPPLSGTDFFKEFNTDKKIEDVIRSGSVIGQAPIVSMPHWGGILSPEQLQALVAYIKSLNN